MSVDLDAIKRSPKLLLEIFGLEKVGAGQKCPCGSSDALSIYRKSERWNFKCHSCGKQGTAIDALVAFKGMEPAAAIKECAERLGLNNGNGNGRKFQPVAKEEGPAESSDTPDQTYPELDLDKAEDLIKKSHDNLLNNEAIQEKWMAKRGLSLEVVEKYRIGFLGDANYAGWVFPLTNHKGKLLAVKRHLEVMPPPPPGEKDKGKSRWVKSVCLGEQSAVRAFWPHPFMQAPVGSQLFNSDGASWLSRLPMNSALMAEWQQKLEFNKNALAVETMKDGKVTHPDDFTPDQLEFCFNQTWDDLGGKIQGEVLRLTPSMGQDIESGLDDWMFLCPGELKALAMISGGLSATSFTHGENTPPEVEELRCFRGRRVAVFYDEDIPKLRNGKIICTGMRWAATVAARLKLAHALEVRILTGGRK